MRLRILNESGLEEAVTILNRLRSGELSAVPLTFLESDEHSTLLAAEIRQLKKNEIENRWQFGVWLYQQLQSLDQESLILEPGLWTWLAFCLFNTICPEGVRGRKIAEDAKYILRRDDYRKFYRHLVSGPYFMIRAHINQPAAVKAILATRPDSPGEVYEQLASRQQIVTSRAAMETATELYWDEQSQYLRRGAGGSGPGSARRLASVLKQYELTYDLNAITSTTLTSMLPKEFARFRGPSSEGSVTAA